MASHKSVSRGDAHPPGGVTDYLEIDEAAAPGTPAAGKARLYVKTDNKLYLKDEAGTETNITGGGGASSSVPEWVAYLAERQSDETPHTDDDFFASDSSADYTEQTVSGTGLWTIGRGVLSCVFDTQTAGDLSAYLKSITSASAPMTIETRMTTFVPTQDFITAGIFFTDGTATGSKSVGIATTGSDGNFQAGSVGWASGTLTSFNGSEAAMTPAAFGFNGQMAQLYMRAIWKSANTWQFSMGWDSNAWLNNGLVNVSYTMTPTDIGFGVSTRGHTSEFAATFDYLRVYDSDLSV